jgi:hypothetical protein
MGLHRLFSVSPAVNYVAPSYVSMVCSLLVTSGLVMLGRFPRDGVRHASDALMLSCDALQLSLTYDFLPFEVSRLCVYRDRQRQV